MRSGTKTAVGREEEDWGEEKVGRRGPCVAWVRPFVSLRALLCSPSRRHFRPARRSFFFFNSLILSLLSSNVRVTIVVVDAAASR